MKLRFVPFTKPIAPETVARLTKFTNEEFGPLADSWQELSPEKQRGVLETVLGAYISQVELSGVSLDAACIKARKLLGAAILRKELQP